MSKSLISCLTQFATLVKVPIGKINLDGNLQPVRLSNNVSITGFAPILFDLLKETKSEFNLVSLEDKAEVRQWLEYCVLYAVHHEVTQHLHQVLTELNDVLSRKTYLVSTYLTVADVVLFYILHHSIESLSYLEKEKYLNVSRWFDNLQQNSTLRQKNKIVDFSTNYLTFNAAARH